MLGLTAPLEKSRFTMPRQVQSQSTTPFGRWLRESRVRRGLVMEALADAADTSQVAISNLERGTRNPSREMVTKLAKALSPEDADEHTATSLLSEGMKAAGFAYEGEIDPELAELGVDYAAGFRELKPENRAAALAVIRALLEEQRKK